MSPKALLGEVAQVNIRLVTGPPTHSVGASIAFFLAMRLSSSSVGVSNSPRCNVTHQGAVSGRPVVLHPIRAHLVKQKPDLSVCVCV